jgi:hypothetical protein
MNTLFKMIPAAIGNDARVNHMKFANTPRVKTGFGKELLKHPVVTDLNISAADTEAAHITSERESTRISMMQNPAHATSFTIHALDAQKLHFSEWIEIASGYLQ